MERALIITDIQNDFLPSGSLAVPNGNIIIPKVKELLQEDYFTKRIYTKDWHPKDHCSFKENGGVWPKHCVQGTFGAEIHKDILPIEGDWTILKGFNKTTDSYSAFKDDNNYSTGLAESLNAVNTKMLYICGLATEYCVKFTVLDALKAGFKVRVIKDCCKGLGGEEEALKEMEELGALIIESRDI